MARIITNISLDFSTLNLNKPLAGKHMNFFNDAKVTLEGHVYEDYVTFAYGFFQKAIFAGKGMVFDAKGVKDGTISAYIEKSSVDEKATFLIVDGFSIKATDVYKAAATPGNADDLVIMSKILSGADTFSLGNGNDAFRGFAGDDKMLGHGGNDMLLGDAGNDWINGGSGSDMLTGGAGRDSFVFDSKPVAAQYDLITDFYPVDDTIRLENAIFTKLAATGALNAAFFTKNALGVAKDANDYIVYETDTGKLFYDADGSGKGAAVLIATLANKAAITAADFVVI